MNKSNSAADLSDTVIVEKPYLFPEECTYFQWPVSSSILLYWYFSHFYLELSRKNTKLEVLRLKELFSVTYKMVEIVARRFDPGATTNLNALLVTAWFRDLRNL